MITSRCALVPMALVLGALVGVLVGTGSQEGSRAEAPPARQAPAARIATADVLGVVERMILSDRYRPAQESFTKEQNDKLKPLADELVGLENRGNTLPANSPDLEALSKEFGQKRDAFERARQEAMGKIEAFNTDQVREAYRLTLQAADQLAKEGGYTHVLSSRTGAATIRSDHVAGALQEILARPVARADAADDLTEKLLRQFKLENVKVEDNPGMAPAPPARAPSPAPASDRK